MIGLMDTLEASCFSPSHAWRYIQGEYAPHYPVPTLIRHVDAGLASGLEQRDADGWVIFKVWDYPMSDGTMFELS